MGAPRAERFWLQPHACTLGCAVCAASPSRIPHCPRLPCTLLPTGSLLFQLCAALGWQTLLLEALPLLPLHHAQQQLVGELMAAAAAAASSASEQQAALLRLVCSLAHGTRQLLVEHAHGSSGSGQGLLERMASLQQLLLACPAAAGQPECAAALQELQSAANSSMPRLMQAMQQQQQAQQEEQPGMQQVLFQELCQLRARLMLALAAGPSSDDDSSATNVAGWHLAAASAATAAQDWRAVLLMPPDVAAASAAAASASAGDASQPSRQVFLAACVAARCYLQACSGPSSGKGTGSSDSGLGFVTEVAALPGVTFPPPPPPAAPAAGPTVLNRAARGGGHAPEVLAAAAEAAADEVERDPGCLGPVQLALSALQLAQQAAACMPAPQTAAGAVAGGQAASPEVLAWPLLLDLAAAAMATAVEPRQQQQLLLLALHGQRPWLQQLRAALAADQQLQQRWRRELVAVANRLASGAWRGAWGAMLMWACVGKLWICFCLCTFTCSQSIHFRAWPLRAEPSTGGGGAPAVVHGEERRRRTAAAVAALLPYAVLCPVAVLDRLVKEAVVQAGEQVGEWACLLALIRAAVCLPACLCTVM